MSSPCSWIRQIEGGAAKGSAGKAAHISRRMIRINEWMRIEAVERISAEFADFAVLNRNSIGLGNTVVLSRHDTRLLPGGRTSFDWQAARDARAVAGRGNPASCIKLA